MRLKINLIYLLYNICITCVAQNPLVKELFLNDCVLSIDFSPDSKMLASGDGGGNMTVWDIETEKDILIDQHNQAVWTVVFNNVGTEVLSGGQEIFEYRKTTIKDKKTEVFKYGNDVGVSKIYSAIFSKNDKKYLLSGTAFNSKNNIQTNTYHSHLIWELTVSNYNDLIAGAGAYGLFLFKTDNSVVELDKNEHRSIDFSPDGKFIVTMLYRNTIQIWDIQQLKLIKEFSIPDNWDHSEAIKWSKDGNFIAAGSYEGNIYIWHVPSGKLVKTFNAHSKGKLCSNKMSRSGGFGVSNIKFSNDGKYLASCGYDKAIRLWDWAALLPIEYSKLLKNEPPALVLTSPNISKGNGFETSNSIVKVTGNVKDSDGIAKLKVKDNLITTDSEGNFELDVALTDGKNDITVEATDKRNGVTSISFTITKDYSVSDAITQLGDKKPRIFAVIVGVSSYLNAPQFDLKYADKDATEFYNFLKSPQGGAVPDENIALFYGKGATRNAILKGIKEKLAYAEETDVFIFYYSGHGDILGNNEQVAFYTYDCDITTNDNLELTGITQIELMGRLSKGKPLKKVLFLDACHSGFLTTTAAKGNGNISTSLINEMSKTDATLTILTSSSNNEKSYEDSSLGGGHGIFTYYLIEGLKGGADKATTGNKNGFVTVTELFKYIEDNVPKQSKKAHGVEQRPKELCDRCNDFPISIVNP